MIYQRYLYKAYLLELLFTDIEVIIDQDILSENTFCKSISSFLCFHISFLP